MGDQTAILPILAQLSNALDTAGNIHCVELHVHSDVGETIRHEAFPDKPKQTRAIKQSICQINNITIIGDARLADDQPQLADYSQHWKMKEPA